MQKRFSMEDIRRVPVQITETARWAISESSAEGRKWPEALAQFFGTLSSVQEIYIDSVLKAAHFPVTPEETDPFTGHAPRLYTLRIVSSQAGVPDHTFYINAKDLCEMYPADHTRGFKAHLSADDLTRLYPYRHVGGSHAE